MKLKFPWNRPHTLGLKATLVSAMLLTIGATAVIVYLPWALISRRNIETIVNQTNQEMAVGTSKEVERLFSNAESAQQLLNSSLSRNLLDLANAETREFFLLSVLESTPAFTWVQYGDANGDFLGAQRTADGRLHFHLRDWDAKTQSTTTTINTYQVEADQLVLQEQQSFSMDPPFYAPDRPWYQSAITAPERRSWTVYVYRSTGNPGMDATKAIVADGKVVGVIGVGIELNQLSNYLAKLQGDRPGETFIINSQQELIAATDYDAVLTDGKDSPAGAQLEKFMNVQNPLLQHAHTVLSSHNIALETLGNQQRYIHTDAQTGERYHVFLTPLEQLDWTVGTVIPESIYTAEINQNKRLLLMAIVLFTGAIAVIAVVQADRLIARPILGIAQAAAAIEAERFELDQLGTIARRPDEIGQLARIFKAMAMEVYEREQRLRTQVQALRVEIDEAKRSQQVKEIVETDFFQDLATKAKALRQRDRVNQAEYSLSDANEGQE